MLFFSDNAAPVHPKVMEAIANANSADQAYDGDRWSAQLDEKFSALFDHPVSVLWVPSGTAANCIALGELCLPHQAIICHKESHIETDECGAPGFYTAGAKLLHADGQGAKITPESVEALLATIRPDVHQSQAAILSITNATEYGQTYSPEEVSALGALCRAKGLKFQMDGARFANAVVSRGCTPADVTVKAGVDALSFGCVKNGGMNAEALIYFDTDHAPHSQYRRKRAGHLLSKGRFLAAQLLAMLEDDLWLENARAANHAARIIANACGDRLLFPTEANEIFVKLSSDEAAMLRSKGFDFYDWGAGQARLVTSWHHSEADVMPLADAINAL